MFTKKNKDIYYIYKDEERKALIKRKGKLIKQLNQISKKLNNYETIDSFLKIEKNVKERFSSLEINPKKNKCLVWFIIKVCGTIFLLLYLISIFQIIGIMNALKKELSFSISLFLYGKERKKEDGNDFYNNYLKTNNVSPGFSFFFLSSLISGLFNNLLGFFGTSLLMTIINALIINFGLNNFDFHYEDNELKENYSLMQFLFLLFLFLSLYLTVGLISLLPIEIIQNGFINYDIFIVHQQIYNFLNVKKINSNRDNINNINIDDTINKDIKDIDKNKEVEIKIDNIINSNKNQSILFKNKNDIVVTNKNNESKEFKLDFKLKGYFFAYLFSFSISIMIKIISNKICINEYNKENKCKINLISCGISTLPILASLIFYLIFKSVYTKVTEKNKNNNSSISTLKFGGYIIYRKVYTPPNSKKCADLLIGLNKINYGWLCYTSSCLHLCQYLFCCKNPCKISKKRVRKDISDMNYKKQEIFIIYKEKGFFSWLFGLITEYEIFFPILFLYILELLNIGFKPGLNSYLETITDKINIINIINIISLLSVLVFYILSSLKCKLGIEKLKFNLNSELENILSGILLVGFFFEIILSTTISILAYNNLIYDEIKFYCFSFSIGSIEFLKIFLQHFFTFLYKKNSLDILPNTFGFTFYIMLWDYLSRSLIGLFNISNNNLLLFQFIIGIVLFVLYIIFIIFVSCVIRIIKNEEEYEKGEFKLIEEDNK